MTKDRTVSVTLRMPELTRDLLKEAADRDHRSMANMAEVLIIRYCEQNGISTVAKRESKKTT